MRQKQIDKKRYNGIRFEMDKVVEQTGETCIPNARIQNFEIKM